MLRTYAGNDAVAGERRSKAPKNQCLDGHPVQNEGVTYASILAGNSRSSERALDSRAAYHAGYYQRTKARRQKLASYRHQRTHWTRWLLANLEWPAELAVTVPAPHPIRRPTLRLSK